MKKKVVIILCVLAALVLLVPIPLRLKDGGTVEYRALLYSVSDVHRLAPMFGRYEEGTIIKLFGVKVYDNVR